MTKQSTLFAAILIAACVVGCNDYKPLPYVPRPEDRQPLVCHDGIGHIKGNKPWILGGDCCCTPTKEIYQRHVADGTIDGATTYEQYIAMYAEKGIVTDLDHKHCGNYCKSGPHVTLGGKCMATPTPGTKMYEQVTYGPHVDLTGGGNDKTKK